MIFRGVMFSDWDIALPITLFSQLVVVGSNAQPKEKKHNNKHAGLAAGNESYSNHKMIFFFF